MYCLFLDLSFDEGSSLALFQNGVPVVSESISSRLIATPHIVIQALLDRAGVSLEELFFLAVGIGPGSYTGLRNAVAVIKTIAYALPHHPKIVLVPSLLTRMPPFLDLTEKKIALVEDAKIGGVYIQEVLLSEKEEIGIQLPIKKAEVLSVDVASIVLPEYDFVVVYPDSRWLISKIHKIEGVLPTCIESSINFHFIGKYINKMFSSGEAVLWNEVKIDYLRKTQAEEERHNKLIFRVP